METKLDLGLCVLAGFLVGSGWGVALTLIMVHYA